MPARGYEMSRTARTFLVVFLSGICCIGSIAAEPDPSPGFEEAMALYRAGRAADAAAAFDALSVKSPADDSLKLWKAIAQLEQARQLRDAKANGYKALIERAYAGLMQLRYREGGNPDWYWALAKAYWLNDRPMKAEKALKKAFYYRPVFPKGWLLLGDIAFERGMNAPPPPLTGPPVNPAEIEGAKAAEEYMRVLNTPALRPEIEAEARYKMGMVESVLKGKYEGSREWWTGAFAIAPDSLYGKMAQAKLERGKSGTSAGGKP
jgi:tetratricopeptide (TPR) repeat protein